MTARLKLAIGPTGLGTVELDGEDISSNVRGVDLSCSVDEWTRATLHLSAVDVDADVEAEVVLPEPLRRALIAQGWTPPPEQDERDVGWIETETVHGSRPPWRKP